THPARRFHDVPGDVEEVAEGFADGPALLECPDACSGKPAARGNALESADALHHDRGRTDEIEYLADRRLGVEQNAHRLFAEIAWQVQQPVLRTQSSRQMRNDRVGFGLQRISQPAAGRRYRHPRVILMAQKMPG